MNYSEFEGKLLGGSIKIVIYDVPEDVSSLLFQEIYKEGLRLQKIFSFYDKNSELSRLNRDRKMKVSEHLLNVISAALKFCKKTKGEYDISIGKQILERKNGKEISKINCSYKNIKIKNNEVSLNHPDVIIDLGSIAKGYIVDRLADFMRKQGIASAFIDARGDLLAFGNYEETIAVRHPREKEKIIHPIKIKNAAIATSGDYMQFYGGYEKSHILNQKELISTTVIANTLAEADVFASAVFLLEKKKREELIKSFQVYKVFAIDKNLKENLYNNFLQTQKN